MSRFARHATNGATAGLVLVARMLAAPTFRFTSSKLSSRCSSGSTTHSWDGTGKTDHRESLIESASASQRSSLDATTVRGKILSNTVLSRNHLTPEIALHLITPECDIYHRPVGADSDAVPFLTDPYWGFFWPGGQALTRFVLDTGHLFLGKAVLDVGCGCGASSIAAKMVGASSVTANDTDKVALQATLMNAKANGITSNDEVLKVCADNLIEDGATTTRYDIVLIGDMFYDTEIAAILHPWMQHLARAGKQIFVGDPGRHGITKTDVRRNMTLKTRYKLPDNVCLENNGFSHTNVWQYTCSALNES